MAEALFRHELKQRGIENVRCESAGLSPFDGEAPSENAVEAMREVGIDISAKRSQRLTMDLLKSADLIVCMTAEHERALEPYAQEIAPITVLGGGIHDPYGKPLNVYRDTREEISLALNDIIDLIGKTGE